MVIINQPFYKMKQKETVLLRKNSFPNKQIE